MIGMKTLTVILFCLSLQLNSFAQDSLIYNKEIFTVVEKYPEFPGGEKALVKFLADNLKYSKIDITNDVYPSKVLLKFVVNYDGTISDIEVLNVVDKAFGEMAINVVKLMPKWKPGIQSGVPVNVYYTLPINLNWQID